MTHLLLKADARRIPLADASVACTVTSPPYWGGLRSYGDGPCIGSERDPVAYVGGLVAVFREVRRVMSPRGTLWLNLGDSFAASGKGGGGFAGNRQSWSSIRGCKGFRMPPAGFKMKDLTLCPFLVADALRRDGWYLRQTIVWSKPNSTEPERADRPSSSHEYLFLLSPSEHYNCRKPRETWWSSSVWSITPDHSTAHPATMPGELARRCIEVGSSEGEIVLDPFGGAMTTVIAALALGRRAIGLDINPDYLAMAARRIERPHARIVAARPEAPLPLFG